MPQILKDDKKQCRLYISSDHLHNAEMCVRVSISDET
jgi:hypothetical protein